jgi:MYXO-CTERM domain-containing protein
MAPGVYSVITSNTANELWYASGEVYGAYSQLVPSEPAFDPGAAVYQYVRLTAGMMLPGYDVTTSLAAAGGGFFDVSVAVTSLYGLSLFDSFDLFWATADNGADSIWSSFVTVPAPPGWTLVGLGLAALAGLRRRRA